MNAYPRGFDLLAGANFGQGDESSNGTYNYYIFSRSDKSTIVLRSTKDGLTLDYALGHDYDNDWITRVSRLDYIRPHQLA